MVSIPLRFDYIEQAKRLLDEKYEESQFRYGSITSINIVRLANLYSLRLNSATVRLHLLISDFFSLFVTKVSIPLRFDYIRIKSNQNQARFFRSQFRYGSITSYYKR